MSSADVPPRGSGSIFTVFGDWGTSRLRLYRMAGGAIVDRADGPGVGALDGNAAAVLRSALGGWAAPGLEIVLCGMAGSRNGLVEAPYAECPANAAAWLRDAIRVELDGMRVLVMPGLACTTPAGAPDVMRGEETQIFGAMALDPALARGGHWIALPGTHSKWARVEDGAVIGFQTWFTGELFALLEGSTLARAGSDETGGDEGFAAGLSRARNDRDLLGALFTARSAQLREGRSRGWALGYLSGLLIGQEIGAAVRSSAPVTLIGSPALTASYGRALEASGMGYRMLDGDACSVAGLQLYRSAQAKDAA